MRSFSAFGMVLRPRAIPHQLCVCNSQHKHKRMDICLVFSLNAFICVFDVCCCACFGMHTLSDCVWAYVVDLPQPVPDLQSHAK